MGLQVDRVERLSLSPSVTFGRGEWDPNKVARAVIGASILWLSCMLK